MSVVFTIRHNDLERFVQLATDKVPMLGTNHILVP